VGQGATQLTISDRIDLGKCSIPRTNHDAPALHIAQSGSVLTIRVEPRASVRVLHAELPASVARGVAKRNGLARWEENRLVVETRAPAYPLWDGAVTIAGSKLTELFVLTRTDDLVYRTGYTPAGRTESIGPWEARLARCRS
jgi:hypothetical protein